jgi:hypothetical protein
MPIDYVQVDWDKPRKLFFDWDSLENLGIACGGLGFVEISRRLEVVDFRVLRKAIWYALRHYDKGVKEADVAGIVAAARKNGVHLPQIAEEIGKAINRSEVLGPNTLEDDGQPPADPSLAPSPTG